MTSLLIEPPRSDRMNATVMVAAQIMDMQGMRAFFLRVDGGIDMAITADQLEAIHAYEGEIIAAVANESLIRGQFIKDSESIASHCQFRETWTGGGVRIIKVTGISTFSNDERAFPLLKWVPLATLLAISPAIENGKKVNGIKVGSGEEVRGIKRAGIRRAGPYKGNEFYLSAMAIADFALGIERRAIVENLQLRRASLWIKHYLDTLDCFYLYRSELLNAWNSSITQDIYGKHDDRKIVPAFNRILKADPSVRIRDVLEITRFHIERGQPAEKNNGRVFEQKCLDLLKANGWQVSTTATSGDFGGDLVAERDGLRWCLQCKDTAKPAGVQAVQQAASATGYYNCDYGAVVSSGGFTEQALSLAARLKVVLVNEHSLTHLGDHLP